MLVATAASFCRGQSSLASGVDVLTSGVARVVVTTASSPSAEGRLDVSLTWPGSSQWLAVGVAASAMSGPIVLCYFPSATSAAQCQMRTGQGTSLQSYGGTFPATVPIASSTTNGGTSASVSFRIDAGALNVGTASSAARRTIVAMGTMSGSTPLQHSDRSPYDLVWPAPGVADATRTIVFQSDSIAAATGLVTMNFSTYTASSGDTIDIQLRWSGDTYAAIGIATTAMSGPISLCYITSAGVGSCTMKLGSGFTLGAHPASSPYPATLPILHTVLNADLTRSITFRVDAAALNINIQSALPLRTLSSVGQMSNGSPVKHTSKQAIQVAWARSTATQTATPTATTTDTGTATPTATSSGSTLVFQSDSIAAATGLVTMNFSTYTASSGDTIDIQLRWSGDTYAAIGIATTAMSGPISLCYITSAGVGSCTMKLGSGFTLGAHPASSPYPATLPILHTVLNADLTRSITFRVDAAALNINIQSALPLRTLSSVGQMSNGSPVKHTSKQAIQVAWARSTATQTATPTATTSLAATVRYQSSVIAVANGAVQLNFTTFTQGATGGLQASMDVTLSGPAPPPPGRRLESPLSGTRTCPAPSPYATSGAAQCTWEAATPSRRTRRRPRTPRCFVL